MECNGTSRLSVFKTLINWAFSRGILLDKVDHNHQPPFFFLFLSLSSSSTTNFIVSSSSSVWHHGQYRWSEIGSSGEVTTLPAPAPAIHTQTYATTPYGVVYVLVLPQPAHCKTIPLLWCRLFYINPKTGRREQQQPQSARFMLALWFSINKQAVLIDGGPNVCLCIMCERLKLKRKWNKYSHSVTIMLWHQVTSYK